MPSDDRSISLPVKRQASLVSIGRGSAYYRAKPVSDAYPKLMRRVDGLRLELPFAGARMLRDLLRAEGVVVGRKHMNEHADAAQGHHGAVQEAQDEREGLRPQDSPASAAHAAHHAGQPGLGDGHPLHPDGAGLRLLGGGDRLVQPPGAGLAAVDRDGHRVLHRCCGRGDHAVRHTRDLQHRSGQSIYQRRLQGAAHGRGIRIAMDGKGCWRDDAFIEPLWRSIKYEEVYLHAYESVSQARGGIGRYIDVYNTRRPHSSLQARTPDVVYFNSLPWPSAQAA